MATLERCFEIAEALEQRSNGAASSFEVTPEVVRELTDFYLVTTDDNRRLLSGLLSGSKAGLMLAYMGTDAAARAIDTGDTGWIRAALLAHIIEGFRWDPRENLREFIFLTYASNRVGADVAALLDEVKFLATEHALGYLRRLANGRQSDADLEANGFKVETKNGRTRFTRVKD